MLLLVLEKMMKKERSTKAVTLVSV
jgi:hypothetical protein